MASILDLPTLVQKVRLAAETKDAEKDAESASTRIGKTMQKAGAGLTAGLTVPIVGLALAGVKAASDLSESNSKVGVVFDKNAESVRKFASTSASSLGISKQAALEATGTFGNLFRALGVGTAPAADMSTSLVKLSSDLASFNNANPDDVLLALRSGLLGEAEPLRQFGVSLSAVRIEAEAVSSGIVKAKGSTIDITAAQIAATKANDAAAKALKEHGEKSIEYRDATNKAKQAEAALSKALKGKVPDLTAAQKAQAAFNIIQKDTTLAQGDFARTSGGLANQQRILSAEFTDMKATLGTALLPIVTQVVGVFVDLLHGFTSMSPEGQKIVLVLAGIAAAMGPLLIIGGTLVRNTKDVISGLKSVAEFGSKAAQGLKDYGEKAVEFGAKAGKAIADVAVSAGKTALSIASSTGEMIANAAKATASAIAAGAAQVASWIATAAAAVASAAATAAAWVAAALPFIALGLVVAAVVIVIVKNWDTIKDATVAVWGFIKDFLTAVFNGIKDAATFVFDAIVAYFRFVFGVYRAIFEAELAVLKFLVTAAWEGIKAATEAVWNGIIGFFHFVQDSITAVFRTAGSWFGGFTDAARAVTDFVRDKLGDLVGFIGGLPGRIAGLAVEVGKAAFNLGKTLIENVVRGLGVVGGVLGDLAKTIQNTIARVLNDNIIDRVNGISISVLGHDIEFPNLPRIPLLAKGGPFSGPFIAGEQGPELVIPRGAGTVVPNGQTDRILEALSGLSGGSSQPLIGSQTIVGLTPEQVDAANRRALRARALSWESV